MCRNVRSARDCGRRLSRIRKRFPFEFVFDVVQPRPSGAGESDPKV